MCRSNANTFYYSFGLNSHCTGYEKLVRSYTGCKQALVAQSVEQLTCNEKVVGSTPIESLFKQLLIYLGDIHGGISSMVEPQIVVLVVVGSNPTYLPKLTMPSSSMVEPSTVNRDVYWFESSLGSL